MNQRTALIADIHGNSPALRTVLDDIRSQGCSQLFVLGDIINGLDPGGCVELLRSWPAITGIKGNAEYYLLTPDLEDFPLRTQALYSEVIGLIHWWRSQLHDSQLAWLAQLSDLIIWENTCLVHDAPLDRLLPEQHYQQGIDQKYQELCYHARGLRADMEEEELQPILAWMEVEQISDVFSGHTHVPFQRMFGTRRICNIGSVGLPLDGDSRATWALVEDLPEGKRTVTLRRIEYPIDETLAIVERTPSYPTFAKPGMQAAYKTMLIHGRHWSRYRS